ncbi:uncharacterized protein [Prorops nasuta]|uniref:uncharacterized protein n=1 Tax=Prorops nasuta TaxID=863751 RepID=UPI0034CFE1A4
MASKQAVLLLLSSFALLSNARALPQDDEVSKSMQQATGGLPFLQFTNGGVRVNFGGYHAEAGLGGLLTGSRTGGGLHASAGTPSGAHASAGLGGLLGGDNGNAGGGLHARAGLGNGRPEAAAGLGGVLDGSGRSRHAAEGALYAGASAGDKTVEKIKTGHTNIQIISRPPKEQVLQSDASASASSSTQAEIGKRLTREKEETPYQIQVRKRIQHAINAPPPPPPPPQPSAEVEVEGGIDSSVPSIDSITVSKGKVNVVESNVPAAPPVPAALPADDNADSLNDNPGYKRWYFRKRFRNPIRKNVYKTITLVDNQSSPSSSGDLGGSADASASASAGTNAEGSVVYKGYKSGSLFDDIFNIPISTLNAVNQLLRNNG